MKFIGIDLGWRSGDSGLCCLVLRGSQLQIQTTERRQTLEEIWAWFDHWVNPEEGVMVAVDAPTIIPNATGTRLPDRLTHHYFGKYHAGCYPANLNRPFAPKTLAVGQALEARHIAHAPTLTPQHPGRYQIEVFPHPAMVNLFSLDRIIKYKKGKLGDRRLELQRLQQYIITHLPRLIPALTDDPDDPLWRSPLTLAGADLKALEDELDSLICAYIGAYWWYWGLERNQVLGNLAEGYIVVPQRLA